MKIDETDKRILEILTEDGRIPNNEIASKLDISEGTVRNRIKKLKEGNFLRFAGLTNLDMREDKSYGFVLVKLISTKRWVTIAEEVSALENVVSVSLTTGRFDLIVEFFIETQNLLDFLTSALPKVDGIASTETLLTIKCIDKWM